MSIILGSKTNVLFFLKDKEVKWEIVCKFCYPQWFASPALASLTFVVMYIESYSDIKRTIFFIIVLELYICLTDHSLSEYYKIEN